MSRFRRFLTAGVLAGVLATTIAGAAGAVSVQHPTVVSANPSNSTPHVLDGKVLSIVQVGNRMVAGGSFTRVANASAPGTAYARSNVFAFDPATGKVDQGFKPLVDKQVDAVAAAPDGTVLIGGSFLNVNGTASKGLAKLRLTDGTRITSFGARTNARVMDLVVRGRRVYLSGSFTSVNGVARSALAAVDASTGTLAGDLNLAFTGPRGGGTLNVRKLDITPNNRLLVAVGNFTLVAGQRRDQVAVINLLTPTLQPMQATVNGWATSRYQPNCSTRFDTYLHDVEVSADGHWFVIVTTGGAHPSILCDTTARWSLTSGTPNQQPTWVNYTGGDTLWSVAITGPAVYVGGHQRWLNNPQGHDSAGPGAVSREGIGAIDPTTGKALAWNPGRARGVGVFDLEATASGLWVGSDTSRIGGENHPRIAFLPLP